jgi:seryl-tRNA synthetase
VLYEKTNRSNNIWKEKIRIYKGGTYKQTSKIDYIQDVAKKALKDKELIKSIDEGKASLTFLGEEVKNTKEFFSKKLQEIDNILPENFKRKTDEELDEIVKKWLASL